MKETRESQQRGSSIGLCAQSKSDLLYHRRRKNRLTILGGLKGGDEKEE